MSEAATWAERHAAAAMAWDTTPNQFVVAACRTLRPGRALDLGAGEGTNSMWLAGRGWHVTAIDSGTVEVGRIQSHSVLLNHPVDAIVGDAVSYRPPPASFDLILLSYLQLPEHQLRRAFQNVVPGLAPGGRVLIIAHDASNLDQGWGGPRDPNLLTTPAVVAAILTGLGLDVRRADVVRREVPTDVGFHVALDHVVEAVAPLQEP
ncbi:MAG TPA: class I SAM-dependent methyltransferase [Propionicimonas sp.]|jgi:SAM-dependent methyltransferase|uniref:class I SAM-dependent methyltransferase n=1 Tax=Propionicimonas sp. TaxID=1955623 RepID=UPI002F3EE7CD